MATCISKRSDPKEKDLVLRQDIKNIFDEGNNIKSTIYHSHKPRFRIKKENSEVKRFTPQEVKEMEIEKLDIETRKKIEARQKNTENYISGNMNLIRYCIAALLMTGQWLSADDLVVFSKNKFRKEFNSGSTINTLRKIFLSSFGQKFLSRKRQGSLYYKIKCPEISLMDIDKAYMLYLGKTSWQKAIEGITELENQFNRSALEGSDASQTNKNKNDTKKGSETMNKTQTASSTSNDINSGADLCDDELIDELTGHLNKALKIARKLKGITFEFEIKSKTFE